MSARQALDRTLLLMRDYLVPGVPDRRLLDALRNTRVVLRSDRANLQSASAQTALITTALLTARSGAQVFLDVPDVPIKGAQPPLASGQLLRAMLAIGDDLVPGFEWVEGLPTDPPDLTILIGDTTPRHEKLPHFALSGRNWTGGIAEFGSRWNNCSAPVGAEVASGLAAGEVFKISMRRLVSESTAPTIFSDLFVPVSEATLTLAPEGIALPDALGEFDCVSGGAIIQSALYNLARFNLAGVARVIEPTTSELSNINRYPLLLRSRVGAMKATDLSEMRLGPLSVSPILARYDSEFELLHGPLKRHVLVGVDHIPTRWIVQEATPAWLGIGATSHYSAMASYHTPTLPCARCLHPTDDDADGPIPTAAFVSHWAGLYLAALFVLERAAQAPPPNRQSVYLTMLRPDSRGAVFYSPVAPRSWCARCSHLISQKPRAGGIGR